MTQADQEYEVMSPPEDYTNITKLDEDDTNIYDNLSNVEMRETETSSEPVLKVLETGTKKLPVVCTKSTLKKLLIGIAMTLLVIMGVTAMAAIISVTSLYQHSTEEQGISAINTTIIVYDNRDCYINNSIECTITNSSLDTEYWKYCITPRVNTTQDSDTTVNLRCDYQAESDGIQTIYAGSAKLVKIDPNTFVCACDIFHMWLGKLLPINNQTFTVRCTMHRTLCTNSVQ